MKKVLFVDDDPSLSELYKEFLTLSGFQTVAMRDSEGVLKKAEEFIPDVIVQDILMPKKDGLKVLKELKNNDKTKNIPVIMFSAMAGRDYKKKSYSLGAKDFVLKSDITPKGLVEKIKTIVR
ncbi:MAG: response regulator [Patescibacteria group bacterium]|nr:response regulator [Patescibacteria group bacterium]